MLLGAMLYICLVLSSCSGPQEMADYQPFHKEASLDRWLNNDLIPYLLQQFDQHPRFKNETILLVRMQDDMVLPQIDDLTDEIRSKIIDALLQTPGIELAWRPAIRPWQHHQRLEDVTCGEFRKHHYHIGIDCGLTRLKRNLYVKVRALNLAEQKWVTGFGRSWEGKPTERQLAALKREHPDEYLRGLRALPFSDQQADLMAVYLARNLSCLLRQTDTPGDLIVYVEPPAAKHHPEVVETALNLVGIYLARFREVEVTDDPNRANVSVIAAIHNIHHDLHQVWVAARQRKDRIYLAGAETEAYVQLDGQQDSYPLATQPPAWPDLTHRITLKEGELISSFGLITPVNSGICNSARPWQDGARQVAPGDHISSGGCLAVEMLLEQPAFVFLVNQDAKGDLTRMFPSKCRNHSTNDTLLPPGNRFIFPSPADPGAGILQLGGSKGMERVYAIAITRPNLAHRFASQLDGVQGLCRPGETFPNTFLSGQGSSHERIQQWQKYLNRWVMHNPGFIQWREIHFWHAPS